MTISGKEGAGTANPSQPGSALVQGEEDSREECDPTQEGDGGTEQLCDSDGTAEGRTINETIFVGDRVVCIEGGHAAGQREGPVNQTVNQLCQVVAGDIGVPFEHSVTPGNRSNNNQLSCILRCDMYCCLNCVAGGVPCCDCLTCDGTKSGGSDGSLPRNQGAQAAEGFVAVRPLKWVGGEGGGHDDVMTVTELGGVLEVAVRESRDGQVFKFSVSGDCGGGIVSVST